MSIAQTFAEARRDRRPVFSIEFFPPQNPEAESRLHDTLENLIPLRPDFVSITYGAGGSTRDRTIELTSQIQRETGVETISHLTCVGHSVAELCAILERLRDEGVHNVLALRGDPPKGQPRFAPHPQGFANSTELVKLVKSYGCFDIAVAGYPEGHIEAAGKRADIGFLKHKVDAGAQAVITQLFFNNAHYFGFVAWARALGVPAEVPIVPGIMPITNLAQIKRFTQMCGASLPGELLAKLETVEKDPAAVARVGVEHAIRQCRELLADGAPGIHFYTLNKSPATKEILQEIRKR